MNAIEEIKEKLTKYPSVRFTESPASIQVHPQDERGFDVGLSRAGDGFVVYFGGWHERFGSKDEALNCFVFGLSDACRLCVIYRGPTPTRWIVESRQDGSWVQDSETGSVFFPFWRKRRVVYKQNHLVAA